MGHGLSRRLNTLPVASSWPVYAATVGDDAVGEAKDALDAAVAAYYEATGQVNGSILSGWLLVSHHSRMDDVDGVISEYHWTSGGGVNYHAALGLIQVGDEIIRMQPRVEDMDEEEPA